MPTEVSDNKEKETKNERKKEEKKREEIPVKYAVTEGTRNSSLQPQQEQERSKTIAE